MRRKMSTSRPHKEFTSAEAVRHRTLDMVAELSQEQADFRAAPNKWSAGEVLDHLVKTDTVIARELEVVFNQRRRGLPFVYRSVADVDTSVPFILRPVLPFFEIPFGIANSLVPPALRRSFTGNRNLPVQAPGLLRPRAGRQIDNLRRELKATYETFRRQQEDHPTFNLDRIFYYNLIIGFSSVPGMYKFIASHEQRHQKQLQEALDAGARPLAA